MPLNIYNTLDTEIVYGAYSLAITLSSVLQIQASNLMAGPWQFAAAVPCRLAAMPCE